MVQETRLDLSRRAALAALALVWAAGSTALAQPLVPNPGLTSLLQPQRLDRSRPLVPEQRAAGTRSGVPLAGPAGGTPCDSRVPATQGSFSAPPAGPSLYGGGSGPGDYGRYVPGAPPPSDSAAKKPGAAAPEPGATRTATADRPLYSGVDRPLWDTGERRATATSGKPTSPGESGKDPSGATPGQPSTIPAPVRDRPLWAVPGAPASAETRSDPTSTSGAGGSIAARPCTTSSTPLLPR